jgi:hypothetical protein
LRNDVRCAVMLTSPVVCVFFDSAAEICTRMLNV